LAALVSCGSSIRDGRKSAALGAVGHSTDLPLFTVLSDAAGSVPRSKAGGRPESEGVNRAT
jgi:hypothetical protein